jgi:hypothetical protein
MKKTTRGTMRTHRRSTKLLLLAAFTGFAAVAASGSTTEPLPSDSASGEASCVFTFKARNYGKTDIYVMLYGSQVQRPHNVNYSWKKLKIQNHRVGPGKRMSRTYTAGGGCGSWRLWRFNVKKGANFVTIRISTMGYNTTTIQLGNLATRF